MKLGLRTPWIASIGLLFALMITLMKGVQTGSYDFTLPQIWEGLQDTDSNIYFVVTRLRLPRLFLAFFTGVVLTTGGFFMQALIKNPLADPYIMGLTAGSGFGVNLVILGLIPVGITALSYPLAAGVGGILSLLLVMLLGFRSFYEDNARLLIAGVAVSSIFTALTGFLIFRYAEQNEVQQMVFWAFGSFSRANEPAVWISGTMALIAGIFMFVLGNRLDLLLLGDLSARTVGLNVVSLRWMLLLVTSLTVGGTVAFTGPIGFVGMMVPHVVRAWLGGRHRPVVIPACLLGGTFLCMCDIGSRHLLPPHGLPIGIVTAILGVPFFLYVLFSKQSFL
ncbi:MAG: iron ABC transporter permease [Bacteroidota bacterium]